MDTFFVILMEVFAENYSRVHGPVPHLYKSSTVSYVV